MLAEAATDTGRGRHERLSGAHRRIIVSPNNWDADESRRPWHAGAMEPRARRKLVVDLDLIWSLVGDERAVRRARQRAIREAEAGRIIVIGKRASRHRAER